MYDPERKLSFKLVLTKIEVIQTRSTFAVDIVHNSIDG